MRMLRYYAVATVIVLAVAVIATLHAGSMMHFHFRSSDKPQPEQHVREGDVSGEAGEGLSGDAPWAMSALPDCFYQQIQWNGTPTYVAAHIPRGMKAVPPGSRLVYGPCTISVRNGELYVQRGNDRFRIPPHATLYRDEGGLALLRRAARASVLRIYTITAQ
jgi:hypothetical protein